METTPSSGLTQFMSPERPVISLVESESSKLRARQKKEQEDVEQRSEPSQASQPEHVAVSQPAQPSTPAKSGAHAAALPDALKRALDAYSATNPEAIQRSSVKRAAVSLAEDDKSISPPRRAASSPHMSPLRASIARNERFLSEQPNLSVFNARPSPDVRRAPILSPMTSRNATENTPNSRSQVDGPAASSTGGGGAVAEYLRTENSKLQNELAEAKSAAERALEELDATRHELQRATAYKDTAMETINQLKDDLMAIKEMSEARQSEHAEELATVVEERNAAVARLLEVEEEAERLRAAVRELTYPRQQPLSPSPTKRR